MQTEDGYPRGEILRILNHDFEQDKSKTAHKLYNKNSADVDIAPALGKIITRTLCCLSACSNKTPNKILTKTMEHEM